ncbi:hypothetical protein N7450_011766 [Penicillium hetheringtonii]|uniref:Transmembrane protein n=1 Tax=Penicillium hetheringtonii TaxID=911720 RepID=A0AAD6DBH7_9EURO|nr:hypothetical protein N7450_011766 [Penicillium hetheringtonii]
MNIVVNDTYNSNVTASGAPNAKRSQSSRNSLEQESRILLAFEAIRKKEINIIYEAVHRFDVPETMLRRCLKGCTYNILFENIYNFNEISFAIDFIATTGFYYFVLFSKIKLKLKNIFDIYGKYLIVQFEQICKKNNIIFICILLYSFYYLQFFDIDYFAIFKQLYNCLIKIYSIIYSEILSFQNNQNSFATTEIIFYNPD